MSRRVIAMEAWRIGEAARRAGVTPHALRHYEALGLLRPGRSPSGQRLYSEEDLARVGFIRRAAALGFTLAEIGEILHLRQQGQEPCGWVRGRLEEKVAAVEARIAELQRLRAELLALKESGGDARSARDGYTCCPLLEAASHRHRGASGRHPPLGRRLRAGRHRP